MINTALLAEIRRLHDDMSMVKDDIKTLLRIVGTLEGVDEWARLVVASTEQSMMITHNDGAIVDDVGAASTGDFAIKRKHPRKKSRKKTRQKKDDVHEAVVKCEYFWGGGVAGGFGWMIVFVSVFNFALGIMGGGGRTRGSVRAEVLSFIGSMMMMTNKLRPQT